MALGACTLAAPPLPTTSRAGRSRRLRSHADCLVVAPTAEPVAVTAALTLSGTTLATATAQITQALAEYFASLAPGATVIRTRIAALIADTAGVVDFVLVKAGRKTLISCKRWKAASHGLEPLRELKAMRQAEVANEAVYVTLGEIQQASRLFAEEHGIVLLQGEALARFLRLPKEKRGA